MNVRSWRSFFFTLWLQAFSILRKMVLGSLVRRKVTQTIWVAGVHQVKFSYTMDQFCKIQLVQLEAANATEARCLPMGGCEKTWLYLVIASLNTLMSCTEPGHPARTNVNLMSKSQTVITFCVVMPLRHMCWTSFITWHHTWYVSAIYCSYTIVEKEMEPRVSQFRMNCFQF